MTSEAATCERTPSLGGVLVNLGIITPEQNELAWEAAGREENRFADSAIKLGFVSEAQIIKGIGVGHDIPYFDDLEHLVTEETAPLVPERICRKYIVVPLFRRNETLMVAMLNPFDCFAIEVITKFNGLKVIPVVSTRQAIFAAVGKLYRSRRSDKLQAHMQQAVEDIGWGEALAEVRGQEPAAGAGEKRIDTTGLTVEAQRLQGLGIEAPTAGDVPLIKLVDRIITEAILARATDIHLEPESRKLNVRYRLDGLLYPVLELPLTLASAIVSRLKIMAKLDIAETRLPQDGHLHFLHRDRIVDLRLATLATVMGEKVVLRILDKESLRLDLGQLGIAADLRDPLEKLINIPNGILLVTGPTGSGKTTTLYALLLKMHSSARNISTLEDPVEYQLDGINQTQILPRIDFTFARGLRALLRQDPDILLVGEIRDAETAEIAIHAALTGHFILSTLHTNDACSALMRLINMNIEPYLVTATVRGVLAQRLLRLLCPRCRVPFTPNEQLLATLGFPTEVEVTTLYRHGGCEECSFTGYRGRIGIFELLIPSPDLQELIMAKRPYHEVSAAAAAEGFRNMRELSLDKVAAGLTSPEELLRITEGVG